MFFTNSKAFTLIEIILVSLVLIVIAGLSLPNFAKTYLGLELKQTTKDVVYLMRYAQSRAVTKGKQMQAEFAPDLKSYWINELSSREESESEEQFNRISGRFGKVYHIPDSVELASDFQKVHFYEDGSIEKVRVYLCLKGKDRCQTVSTKEQRAAVKVYDGKIN